MYATCGSLTLIRLQEVVVVDDMSASAFASLRPRSDLEVVDADDIDAGCIKHVDGADVTIVTPHRIKFMKCPSAQTRCELVDVMRAHLRARLGDKLWAAKVEAGRISLPLIQEQIRLNSQLYNDFRERLVEDGPVKVMESVQTSRSKPRHGVLEVAMITSPTTPPTYRSKQFILMDGALYWFPDNDHRSLESCLALKYASVALDETAIREGEFAMDVQTPLRMLKLRAKHAVSLAEWFHSLVSAISQTNTGLDVAGSPADLPPDAAVADVDQLIAHINSIQASDLSICDLDRIPDGEKRWRDYLVQARQVRACTNVPRRDLPHPLSDSRQIDLWECRNDVPEWRLTMPEKIVWKYLLPTAPHRLPSLPSSIAAPILAEFQSADTRPKCRHPRRELFDPLLHWVTGELNKLFAKWRMSIESATAPVPAKDNDKSDLQPDQCSVIVAFANGSNNPTGLAMCGPDQPVVTIGRDSCNTLPLADERVSRAHAKIVYVKGELELFDIGSLSGTRVNNSSVGHKAVKVGDEIVVGTSTIRIEQRKARPQSFGTRLRQKLASFGKD
ncbi:hypothetical protein PBRA_007214 [Plasmodiophora brassicae]|uniref:FHA domain-containing protein n=1 Tax=Plasmodiophora brassicae TaxID=37360 RepID=A0A0G4IV19_PLABS|nr:hypothetical protein PBRA_007214 [Plasmodiophora brassicae]